MRSKIILLFFALTIITTNLSAQKPAWKSINMIDTIAGYTYSVENINNPKYGPTNLFDNNLETCWVAGTSAIYLRVPQYNKVLNIFNGYGKSLQLYQQNSRVKKLRISFYLGVQPEGHISEVAEEYYLYDPHISQDIEIEDAIGIKHIALLDSMFEDQLILIDAFNSFARDVGYEINEVNPIIKIQIVETYPGSKYRDICVSELFFGDKYMIYAPKSSRSTVDSVYINEDENTLIARLSNGNKQEIYTNKNENVWLSEVSTDKEWVIIMTMEAESRGKGLTNYKLINTKIMSVVNDDLDHSLGKNIAEMYFDYKNSDLFLLCTETPIPEEHLIWLGNK